MVDKTNTFGLRQDAAILREALKHVDSGNVRIREADPLEPPVPCDVAIHLEVPVYGWMPWCLTNFLLLNPEWYYQSEWEGYLKHFDGVIFRDESSEARFNALYPDVKTWVLPWTIAKEAVLNGKNVEQSMSHSDGFVWFLGGSVSKRAAATAFLPFWKESYPALHVYATKELDLSGQTIPENVTVTIEDLNADKRRKLAAFYPGHVVLSKAEAFGYTAAEAQANGAFMILNDLEAYKSLYSENRNCAWVTTPKVMKNFASVADFTDVDPSAELDAAISKFLNADLTSVRSEQKVLSHDTRDLFLNTSFGSFWKTVKDTVKNKKPLKAKNLPPVLNVNDCPSISIVTLLYNRRKFFDLACHNIMLSDYPKDKIEWVVVEDSDDPNEDASDRVVQVGLKAAPLTLVYIPLDKKTPIGAKRNIGIQRAKNEIILMMDDDDHYPQTSFRRRVAWLTKHPWKPKAVACTTIACYHLIRGVSAVNMPPWTLPLRQRISEATLTFYRSWWEEQKFPASSNMAEGEGLLLNRESDLLEIPPQQIIVAFSHKDNTSGRRIPADDAKPGCFWGFPKEFLIYIHKLVGVEVEEEK